MTGQRILLSGLWIAIVSVAVSSGDAEARCRCRGRGWGQNNGYNSGSVSYGNQCGCNNGQFAYTNGNMNAQGGYITNGYAVSPQPVMVPTNTVNPANTTGIQPDGTYSTSKPALNAPAPAPQPVDPNSSPDVDNEGRNASKIPGTAPTKAPAPAANE